MHDDPAQTIHRNFRVSCFTPPILDDVERMPGRMRGEAREWVRLARVMERLEELGAGAGVTEALALNKRRLAEARIGFFRHALAELERELEVE
jgi:hypothetical protein